MRQLDANTLNALSGSRAGESLTAHVWYNGRLAYPNPLPISGARFSWDRTRQIQSLDISISDADGVLAPWLFEDALGVGGSRLQVRHNIGGAGSVNIGWYRITAPQPAERWQSYIINEAGRVNKDSSIPTGKKLAYVSGGSTIQVAAADLGILLKNDPLLAPESPPVGASIVSEVKRLVGMTMPVVVHPGVVDRSVNTTLVYEKDRLDAIQALCKSITCDYRMTGDGQLEVYPLSRQTSVATLQGGPEGLLVEVDRAQKLEGLYNTFVVDGTAPDRPVRSVVEITTGPLRVSGPHGRYTKFYESNMIVTQAQAHEYALQMRDTHLAGLTVDITVSCLPVPHIQQGDWVTVANPVVGGQVVPLTGLVKSVDQPWSGTVPGRATVVVECSYSDVQTVIGGTRG